MRRRPSVGRKAAKDCAEPLVKGKKIAGVKRAPSEWMERCLDAVETKLKKLGTELVEGGTFKPLVCVESAEGVNFQAAA